MHERDRIIILFSFYSCYFYCSSITTLHFNNYEKKKKKKGTFLYHSYWYEKFKNY